MTTTTSTVVLWVMGAGFDRGNPPPGAVWCERMARNRRLLERVEVGVQMGVGLTRGASNERARASRNANRGLVRVVHNVQTPTVGRHQGEGSRSTGGSDYPRRDTDVVTTMRRDNTLPS